MFNYNKDIDFSDYILIIPCVSVGNVGQLTCDLIISTFNLKKVATVWHPAIVPVYGPNPFDKDSTDNCMACELYASEEHKFAVFQIRSGIEPQMRTDFLNDFKKAITEAKFKNFIILTSSFAYELHNLSLGFYRYLSNYSNIEKIFEERKIPVLENTDDRITIHGSGFAVRLYELFKESSNCTIIIKYASEGDNRPDAVSMLEVLMPCLNIKDCEEVMQKVVFPHSWELVFGSPPPVGIY